jgi:hypothetical protein
MLWYNMTYFPQARSPLTSLRAQITQRFVAATSISRLSSGAISPSEMIGQVMFKTTSHRLERAVRLMNNIRCLHKIALAIPILGR